VNQPFWLDRALGLEMHALLIKEHGGRPGLRDEGLLDAALARARNKFAYDGPDLFDLAAAYAFGLARNHPFVDGNKRIALAAADVFLQCNGWELTSDEAETVVAFLDLAAGKLTEAQLASWFRANAQQLP
jgi:death-on-curing protein